MIKFSERRKNIYFSRLRFCVFIDTKTSKCSTYIMDRQNKVSISFSCQSNMV